MTTEFICPECGSQTVASEEMVETIFDKSDAWSAVLRRYQCAGCRSVIPAHLGERWSGVALDEARREWREIYKESQPRWEE